MMYETKHEILLENEFWRKKKTKPWLLAFFKKENKETYF